MAIKKISILSTFTFFGTLALTGPTKKPCQLPNTSATFGDKPASFTIDVNAEFIEDTRKRVANARLPDNVDAFGYNDGPSLQNATALKNYWANGYDWKKVQKGINSKFTQFTTTVRLNEKNSFAPVNYTDPVPLHFVHQRSKHANAIPLLFVHGWPGSFLEVSNIIEPLVNPKDPKTQQPFHVVAPSIPGFGFSPAPTKPGMGLIAAADVFNSLMVEQLGYKKYVTQGGDLGSEILRHQAQRHPDNCVSFLSNFWLIAPNATDTQRFAANQTSPGETRYIAGINQYVVFGSGYRFMAQTQPGTLSYATTDSPLGLAMWIYAIMRRIVDPNLNPNLFSADSPTGLEEIITWSMMYLIQGPYQGYRLYKEAAKDGAYVGLGFGAFPYVKIPVAASQYPFDIGGGLPLDWAQREGNVKELYVHKQGGHFAAYEVPDQMVDDIRKWFSDERSNVPATFMTQK